MWRHSHEPYKYLSISISKQQALSNGINLKRTNHSRCSFITLHLRVYFIIMNVFSCVYSAFLFVADDDNNNGNHFYWHHRHASPLVHLTLLLVKKSVTSFRYSYKIRTFALLRPLFHYDRRLFLKFSIQHFSASTHLQDSLHQFRYVL